MENYFRKYTVEIISIAVGITILLFSNLYIYDKIPFLQHVLNIIGGTVGSIPSIMRFYRKYTTAKQIEEQFIAFMRDLTEAIKSGMTLPTALKTCAKKSYYALTPFVRDLSSQIEWGIPFQKALEIFSNKTKNKTIRRSINTIIQTYKVGGKLDEIMSAVSKSLAEINKIKQERSASVHSQIVTSYLIFFIFIFILVILQTFLIPALSIPEAAQTVLPNVQIAPMTEVYTQSFLNFIIIQGFFAGLVTGKLAEGSLVAGTKHSLFLIAIGYAVFSLAIQFQIKLF